MDEYLKEWYAERVAIMHHDGELSLIEARKKAYFLLRSMAGHSTIIPLEIKSDLKRGNCQ